MASFITPFRPIVNDWDWNPGQTFVTSFMLAQENKRAQEKAAQEAELMQILLPYKQQTAALELEKLQQEVERSTFLTKKIREGGRSAHQAIMDGLQNPSQNQSVSGLGQWNTTVRVRKKPTGSSGVTQDLVDQVDAATPLPFEDEDIVVPPSP
jgi:hypothetical protein